jgi:hypothetical protein
LYLQGGAFEHTRERRGIGWLDSAPLWQGLDALGQELFQCTLEGGDITTTVPEHVTGRFFVDKGIEQMLERHIFVTPLPGLLERSLYGLLELMC